MRFRKKPVVIEATLWNRNGDHPEDGSTLICGTEPGDKPFLTEGKVVRRFRRPDVPGFQACKHCDTVMEQHGWIDTLEGGHIVCPGDWVITGVKGERYPCKPAIFKATYELVDGKSCRHEHWVVRGADPIGTAYCEDCGTTHRIADLFNAQNQRVDAVVKRAEALLETLR